MKVVITGATGFIGRHLTRRLIGRGDSVTALTRSPEQARSKLEPGAEAVSWHPPQADEGLIRTIGEADAIVNLAGEPVADKRWTAQQKERIQNSRIYATTAIVDAIRNSAGRPQVLVNGSAVGFYGSRGAELLTESSAAGGDFLAGVVVAWEAAARQAEQLGVRTVFVRTGIVLGTDGGALPRLLLPFKLYSGGIMGNTDQWVSWIHIDDEVGLIIAAIDGQFASGPVNATAPNPMLMPQFSRAIGKALDRPTWVPGLPVLLKLAMGERSDVVLASQRVEPHRAEEAGYKFAHTEADQALRSLLRKQ